MSRELRTLFILHALVSLLLGAPLVLFPGPFLGALGWTPIDPIITRVAGAAILAMGYSSMRAWLADSPQVAVVLIEMEAVFSIVAVLGLLRHLLISYYLPAVDFSFGLLLVLAAAWIVFRLRERP